MKHFFIARHGAYYLNGHLNKLGEQQIRALAQAMRAIINGDRVHIISSTAPRALDSAAMLARELGLRGQLEELPCLWFAADSEHYPPPVRDFDPELIYGIVAARQEHADVLILMAHEELRDAFAAHFCRRQFGRVFPFATLEKGQADHFDIATASYQLIPKESIT